MLATVNDAKREAVLQRADELAIDDTGIVPVHSRSICGRRDGITYVPRTDENTLPWKFRPPGESDRGASSSVRDERS